VITTRELLRSGEFIGWTIPATNPPGGLIGHRGESRHTRI
jgi:hypothetical protein